MSQDDFQESDMLKCLDSLSGLQYIIEDLGSSPGGFIFNSENLQQSTVPEYYAGTPNVSIQLNGNHRAVSETHLEVQESKYKTEIQNLDLRSGPTGLSPATEDYLGPYNFEIHPAKSSPASRRSWVYSEKLHKVFITMDKVLLMNFILKPPYGQVVEKGLKIRALLMYSCPDDFTKPVSRCFNHSVMFDKRNDAHPKDDICLCKDFENVGHVLTVDHEWGNYEFDSQSYRHSVSVPIDNIQPTNTGYILAYLFGCKTSCIGGMSRRPAKIIFTLETSSNEVVGRRSLPFKVCSCPKRDKEREESDFKNLKQFVPPRKRKIMGGSVGTMMYQNGGSNRKKIMLQDFQNAVNNLSHSNESFTNSETNQLTNQEFNEEVETIKEEESRNEELVVSIGNLNKKVENLNKKVDNMQSVLNSQLNDIKSILMELYQNNFQQLSNETKYFGQ